VKKDSTRVGFGQEELHWYSYVEVFNTRNTCGKSIPVLGDSLMWEVSGAYNSVEEIQIFQDGFQDRTSVHCRWRDCVGRCYYFFMLYGSGDGRQTGGAGPSERKR